MASFARGEHPGENLATATPERLAIRAAGGRVERTGPVRFARGRDPRWVGRGRNPPPTGSEPDRRTNAGAARSAAWLEGTCNDGSPSRRAGFPPGGERGSRPGGSFRRRSTVSRLPSTGPPKPRGTFPGRGTAAPQPLLFWNPPRSTAWGGGWERPPPAVVEGGSTCAPQLIDPRSRGPRAL